MTFERNTIIRDGAALVAYSRPGAGTPIVLAHGFGGSHSDWDQVLAGLPADRPVIAYDLRGFGESEADLTVAYSHTEDLVAMAGTLGLGCFDCVGLSLGGATALNAALSFPDAVRRLVLVSPLMAGWEWSREWIDQWKAIGRLAREDDMTAARKLWFAHPLFAPARAIPTAADKLRTAIEAYSGAHWVTNAEKAGMPDIERLSTLAVPTLLLTGKLDTPDFRLIGDVLEQAAPDLARIDIPGAGHMLNLERPAEIAQAIARFLA